MLSCSCSGVNDRPDTLYVHCGGWLADKNFTVSRFETTFNNKKHDFQTVQMLQEK